MKRKGNRWGILFAAVLLAQSMAGCSAGAWKEAFSKEKETEITIGQLLNEDLPEKELEESQTALYYGYQSLLEEEQKIYRQFIKGLEEFQEEISLSPVSEERLSVIVNMAMIDHPEYFWTDGAFQYWEEEWSDGSSAGMKIAPTYLVSKKEAQDLKRQIEEKAEEWLETIPRETDTYGKIKAVYELLIRNVSSDENSPDNQNIRSVFLGGKTVCMGYSKATQYLLNKMGIFCTLVVGEIADEENSSHAWNLVKIGEKYYYVDTTWGNPNYEDESQAEVEIYYSYLCCTGEFLGETHIPNDDIPLPVCEDDSYNYYKNAGCWYDSYDYNQIYNVLLRDMNAGARKTELYFGSQEAYDQAAEALVNGSLVQDAAQNASVLRPGEGISWDIYSGGSDRLLVLVWSMPAKKELASSGK